MINQITLTSDLSAKRSTSLHHCSIRCTLTPNYRYVSRYQNNTFQQVLDRENLRIDLPYIK